jgi:biopolymer transport protein ExbB/TolQ
MSRESSSSWVLWLVLGIGCLSVGGIVAVAVAIFGAGLFVQRSVSRDIAQTEVLVEQVEREQEAARAERERELEAVRAEAAAAREQANAEREAREAAMREAAGNEPERSGDPLDGLNGL